MILFLIAFVKLCMIFYPIARGQWSAIEHEAR